MKTKTPRSVADRLRALNACRDAIEWAETQPSAAAAWRDCQRGDWMLWLLGCLAGPSGSRKRKRRRLVFAACECARLALPHVPAGEERPLRAIETAEAWARGEGPTLEGVRTAAYAAYDAAAAAYAASAADAASSAAYAAAAAYAASAASAAADAAASAASAASAAADAAASAASAASAAADAAAYDAAAAKALATCADIVRRHYPRPPRVR